MPVPEQERPQLATDFHAYLPYSVHCGLSDYFPFRATKYKVHESSFLSAFLPHYTPSSQNKHLIFVECMYNYVKFSEVNFCFWLCYLLLAEKEYS